jgi:hypothetical protein
VTEARWSKTNELKRKVQPDSVVDNEAEN